MTDEALEERVVKVEASISAIEERNARVEMDKRWETSRTRKCWLLVITYILTALVFWLIGVEDFLLNAVIPTFAYFLSTLSLPIARSVWENSSRGA